MSFSSFIGIRELLTYVSFLVLFFILEVVYFQVAMRYKIIDKPNERSSHLKYTIRGGGIIFPIAVLAWFMMSGFQAPYFVAGLLLISVVSFIDDIEHIHTKVRFVFQLLAIALMLYQIPFTIGWFWLPVIFFMLVGTVNAYNFMDGINGITGLYSLSVFIPLLWLNSQLDFIDSQVMVLMILALVVFGFFNFRTKAKCFAGDIGSISLAFIICYLLINAVIVTGNFAYILFLLLYGLDAGTTLFFRVLRRENIFEAHRSHFYQYLANEQRWPHLTVPIAYGVIQILINALIIVTGQNTRNPSSLSMVLLVTFIITVLFVLLRFKIEGKERLLSPIRTNDIQ